MRIGETLRLHRDDVDLDDGVLTITGPKSGHTRLVPLQPSTTAALRRYAAARDRFCPTPRADTFFISTAGTRLIHGNIRSTFIQLSTATGIRTETVRPRIHDLRHSFIIDRLLDWYRCGADPAARMPVLSTYVGHVNPAGTYWYLSAVPELMRLAAQRLSQHLDDQQAVGRS
jgi:integrase/recombinase XerD